MMPDLTEAELHACLKLESETQRRKSLLSELVTRLLDLHREKLFTQLKETYPCLANLP